MLGLALLPCLILAIGAGQPEPWIEPERSFGWLAGFQVRVDVHAAEAERARISEGAIREQIEAALRRNGIEVLEGMPITTHGMGFVVLDVHVVPAGQGTAVAWSLHASQVARLWSGSWTFASTWEVGDLIQGPADTMAKRLERSVQPAIQDFCDAYRAARRMRSGPKAPKLPDEATEPAKDI